MRETTRLSKSRAGRLRDMIFTSGVSDSKLSPGVNACQRRAPHEVRRWSSARCRAPGRGRLGGDRAESTSSRASPGGPGYSYAFPSLATMRIACDLSARLALALVLSLAVTACASDARPNVVLIVLDTARADRFAWSEGGRDVAPRIAALARDATVYTEAWSPAPWTVPAHASLFTGRYPSAHRTDCGALRLPDAE